MYGKRTKKYKKRELFMLVICIACVVICTLFTAKRNNDTALNTFAASSASSEKEKENTADEPQITLYPTENEPIKEERNGSRKVSLSFSQKDKPVVLIYHTHTLESYTPTEKYPYRETDGRWRTDDATRSIVAVGDALARELEKCGFTVIHDTTNHEPPKLSTAYERSLVTMEKYKSEYPIDIYIDLHRDASDESNTKDYVTIDGEQAARVMFVVGHGTRYDEKPDFEKNYAAAECVTKYLRSINPSFARNIREKPGRYNQHVGGICMLIEIGHNMNTLEQALCSTKYVAEGIAQYWAIGQ